MTINQLFLALVSIMLTLFGLAMAFFKYYIDAKSDPIARDVSVLVQFMVTHR